MRFQVPQFINVEDKIFGALSAKQFIYLAGGGGISYVLWKLLPSYLAIIFIAPIVILAVSLAFVKINTKPFIFILEAAFNYFRRNKLYVWRKETRKFHKNHKNHENNNLDSGIFAPKLSNSKLRDISWSLDVNKNLDKKNN